MIFLCHYSVLPNRSATIKIDAPSSCEAMAKLLALPELAKAMQDNGAKSLIMSAFPETRQPSAAPAFTEGESKRFGVAMSSKPNDELWKEAPRKA